MESAADIGLADFWNCENRSDVSHLIKDHTELGVSLIVIYSEKAKAFLEECDDSFYKEQVNDIKAITTNVAQIMPAKYNRQREKFFRCRSIRGTYKALNKYAKYTYSKKIYNKILWKIWAILGKYK